MTFDPDSKKQFGSPTQLKAKYEIPHHNPPEICSKFSKFTTSDPWPQITYELPRKQKEPSSQYGGIHMHVEYDIHILRSDYFEAETNEYITLNRIWDHNLGLQGRTKEGT